MPERESNWLYTQTRSFLGVIFYFLAPLNHDYFTLPDQMQNFVSSQGKWQDMMAASGLHPAKCIHSTISFGSRKYFLMVSHFRVLSDISIFIISDESQLLTVRSQKNLNASYGNLPYGAWAQIHSASWAHLVKSQTHTCLVVASICVGSTAGREFEHILSSQYPGPKVTLFPSLM